MQGRDLITIDVVFGVMPCGREGCDDDPQDGPDNAVNIEADPILAQLPVPFTLRAEAGVSNDFDLSTKASQEEVYSVLDTLFEPASLRGEGDAASGVPRSNVRLTNGVRDDPLQVRTRFAAAPECACASDRLCRLTTAGNLSLVMPDTSWLRCRAWPARWQHALPASRNCRHCAADFTFG